MTTAQPVTLVLGAGIVGRAAVWDLVRRGHHVTVADQDRVATAAAAHFGAEAIEVDVTDRAAVEEALAGHDVVVSAVPYRFGVDLAEAAIATGTHYLDFGGNPTVVKAQLALDETARRAGVAVVPDCGLAPGLADALAEDFIAAAEPGPIDTVQMRVGALPARPTGALGYQLAFSPAGLVNEYAEPCEVIEDGVATTVQPLSRFESVEWEGWGPLEAFSTAGGTSSMCADHAGRVDRLEYKTLRYPGHGQIFRALLELGMFSERPRRIDGVEIAPRQVLVEALARNLPARQPDVVLLRVWIEQAGRIEGLEIVDRDDGRFSALARTTAFPATALADLVARGTIDLTGAVTMHRAVPGRVLLEQMEGVGVVATPWPIGVPEDG
jgi:lysine 6-dehydrogenase